jgi:cell wall-associated NlpC family hydrolase
MFPRRLPQATAVFMALLAAGCASTTGAIPHPFPTPGEKQPVGTNVAAPPSRPAPPADPARPAPPAVANANGSKDGYSITGTALSLRGIPYVNGGTDPRTGFDCSGFTQYVYREHGVKIPRDVHDQFSAGKKVNPDELAVGDLIFFSTTAKGPTHVGIAIGGDQFIHAPSSTGVVRIERFTATYWKQRFLGARRVL